MNQIVNAVLELIQQAESSARINLRESARTPGCAHTDLYNYFDNFDAMLWAALDEASHRLHAEIAAAAAATVPDEPRLKRFLGEWINFYLAHHGWARLFWSDPLSRPLEEQSITATVILFGECLRADGLADLTPEQAFACFHMVDCYLYGEVPIFISNRGLIQEEDAFRDTLLREWLRLTGLLVANGCSNPIYIRQCKN